MAKLILSKTLPVICVLSAVYLMANDKSGWGWLLFAAIACSISVNAEFKEK